MEVISALLGLAFVSLLALVGLAIMVAWHLLRPPSANERLEDLQRQIDELRPPPRLYESNEDFPRPSA